MDPLLICCMAARVNLKHAHTGIICLLSYRLVTCSMVAKCRPACGCMSSCQMMQDCHLKMRSRQLTVRDMAKHSPTQVSRQAMQKACAWHSSSWHSSIYKPCHPISTPQPPNITPGISSTGIHSNLLCLGITVLHLLAITLPSCLLALP